ncbi:hypothetical protein [Paracoccus suum]|uniref:hypothetical protein n=1 Tax=Paracoccus suum TaxID=2259340 RepID=UPI0018F02DE9|nr:hypothetical protein [Paracoccus suum]
MMLLAAIDEMKAAGEDPAVNVKVLLDSDEEQGSPTLGGVIERNLDQLKADALVVLDGPMHESNRPTLVFGNRGLQAATLTVFGGTSELHSGHYGNYAPTRSSAHPHDGRHGSDRRGGPGAERALRYCALGQLGQSSAQL